MFPFARQGSALPNRPTRAISLAFSLALVACSIAPSSAGATTHTVCPIGTGTCDFQTIEAALASTSTTGDTILVSAGTYRPSAVPKATSKHAGSGSPTVLLANGQVIIDGADPFGAATWTQGSGSIYWASRAPALMLLPFDTTVTRASYVFVGDTRYKYVANNSTSLNEGEWSFDSTASRVYVRMIGSASPAGQDINITDNTRLHGLQLLKCDNFVIDGFTIKRTSGAGVLIEGTTTSPFDTSLAKSQGIVVKNCSISNCFRQGMQLTWTTGALATKDTTYSNGFHGIHIVRSDNTSITHNVSYLNDYPLQVRGGVNGIHIGGGAPSTWVSDVNADYNIVHDNEDTGIDINGAHRVVVRRNLSYRNRDHGFDNNVTDSTVFINNTAFGNEHDGLSIENTSAHVGIYNCIFAYNAHNAATLASPSEGVFELEVNGTSGFTSDYNDFVGWGPGATGPSGERHLFKYNGVPHDTLQVYRNVSGQDVSSFNTLPAFADTGLVTYDFTIKDGAYLDNVIDAAKTDITGWTTPMWLDVDPHGIAHHDAFKTNVGSGSPTNGDIGAFEYDPPPAPIAPVTAACDPDNVDQWRLDWTAVSDDTVSNAVAAAEYQVKTSLSHITTESDWNGATLLGGPTPNTPGQGQTFWVQALVTRYFSFRARDANQHWSPLSTDIAINPSTDTLGCTFGWYGGGGGGGGGGGCGRFCDGGLVAHVPTLTSLRRPAGGVDTASVGENTILNAAPTGTYGEDLLPIEAVQNAAGLYLAHLRVTGGHGTLVNGVRLLFVDHPVGTEVFAYGSTAVTGLRSQASRAITETGADVTKLLDGTGGIFNAADAVEVTVSTPLDSLKTPLVIECANGGMRGHPIIVESQTLSGWREVGSVYPRRLSSACVIDSVPAGPVRLRFTGYAWVSSVARLARETAQVTSTWGTLEGARSASSGDVFAAIGAEDTAATALVGPDTLWTVFSGPPLGQGVVRSAFLRISARTVTASAAINAAARGVSSLPTQFAMYQNVPNPFRGSTTFRLDLPVGRMVRLEIFDVSGRRVRTLVNHFMPAGRQSVAWNQRDDAGATLGAGVYFARVQVDTFRDRKKLVLMP